MPHVHWWLILEFCCQNLSHKTSRVHSNDMSHFHSSRYLLPPPPSVASRSRPFSKPPSNIPSTAHSKVPSKNPTPIPESPVQPIIRNSPVIRPASKAQTLPAKSPTVKTSRQETPAEKKTLDAVLDIVANISNSFKRGNNHLLAVNFLCAWLLIQYLFNEMQYTFILYAINLLIYIVEYVMLDFFLAWYGLQPLFCFIRIILSLIDAQIILRNYVDT